jgi:hypothetical protein
MRQSSWRYPRYMSPTLARLTREFVGCPKRQWVFAARGGPGSKPPCRHWTGSPVSLIFLVLLPAPLSAWPNRSVNARRAERGRADAAAKKRWPQATRAAGAGRRRARMAQVVRARASGPARQCRRPRLHGRSGRSDRRKSTCDASRQPPVGRSLLVDVANDVEKDLGGKVHHPKAKKM